MARKYHFGKPPEPEPPLDDFQKECVRVFQRAASAFSLAPSVGQIYGLLFSTPEPLCLDQIVERLKASRGGSFQSLRWLRQLGVVTGGIYKPDERREYFQAERNLRKLAAAFLNAQIEPHLQNATKHLGRLRKAVADGDNPASEFQRQRLEQLERWHQFSNDVLPFIRTFAEKF